MIVTPNAKIKHQGEQTAKGVAITVSDKVGEYLIKMGWAEETPGAEALLDYSHWTISDDVVDNATGKRVFA